MEIAKQYFVIHKKVLDMRNNNNPIDFIREGIYFCV